MERRAGRTEAFREVERVQIIESGYGSILDRIYLSRDLAKGDSIVFCATIISDSPLLRGVEVHGEVVKTHSVMMRVINSTMHSIKVAHDSQTSEQEHRGFASRVLVPARNTGDAVPHPAANV